MISALFPGKRGMGLPLRSRRFATPVEQAPTIHRLMPEGRRTIVKPNLRPIILAAALAGAFLHCVDAQTAPLVCTASAAPIVVRMEGKTEPVGDLILTCSGGMPTPVNQPVPQVNINVFLNTVVTTRVTADNEFTEALLLVDEPNTLIPSPQRRLLNCGQVGAFDSSPAGAGVCEIISNGNPAQTYDGTPNARGTRTCILAPVYGCGRPNAFQGRIDGPSNLITFLHVPFDPPGPGTRMLRITNLRANVAMIGPGTVNAYISITGPVAVTISSPAQVLAFSAPGLNASITGTGIVQVSEGFGAAWKDRNIAFTVGNPPPGNADFNNNVWTYNGRTSYPLSVAQSVPGVAYNTEDMFQWQNNGVNGPPSPNPPEGFNTLPVANLGMPLQSLGFGGKYTKIEEDGVASQGTRIALQFSDVPPGAHVACATSVPLHRNAVDPPTGVLVMTATDSQGAGVYAPVQGSRGTSAPGLVVYEILYADPSSVEFADIPCYLVNAANQILPPVSVTVRPQLAPFFNSPSSNHPTPTSQDPTPTDLPRFAPGSITLAFITRF